jgi:hypothetical protein
MPTLIHGVIQFNLGIALNAGYSTQYRFASEVLLDKKPLPLGSTPDLIIYPRHDSHLTIKMTLLAELTLLCLS